jgi:hypothetical protein
VANEKKDKGKKVVVENTTIDINKIKETKIVISFM